MQMKDGRRRTIDEGRTITPNARSASVFRPWSSVPISERGNRRHPGHSICFRLWSSVLPHHPASIPPVIRFHQLLTFSPGHGILCSTLKQMNDSAPEEYPPAGVRETASWAERAVRTRSGESRREGWRGETREVVVPSGFARYSARVSSWCRVLDIGDSIFQYHPS